MKSKFTKLALTAALGLALAFTFTACGKGGGDVKLLETITDEGGNVQKRFEYDKQNRIVKIDNDTITYADNLITVGTQKFAINGNTVTVDGKSYTIDKDGYIVKSKEANYSVSDEYKYKDGNLIKISWSYEDVSNYSYDNKKSPFSNCTTPKWLIQHLLRPHNASENNAVDAGDGREDDTYKYEYDSDGFPVKATVTTKYYEGCEENCETTTIIRYSYRGEPQNATVKTETPAASEAAGKITEVVKGSFADSRDSKTYKTVKIGEQVWMAENLNYKADGYGDECYDAEESNCKKYGRLYDWETARSACPKGWHLPNKEEWEILMAAVGGRETAGKYLKATNGWNKNGNGEDKYGFSALPGGHSDCCEGGGFFDIGGGGGWWSFTEENSVFVDCQLVSYNADGVDNGTCEKYSTYSVRCLQDNANYAAKAAEAEAKAKAEALKAKASESSFTDSRDNKTYKTVKIGEQVWMAENLNIDLPSSKCYNDDPANCTKYGRMYNWETAKSACPSGWHLPSYDEIKKLKDFVGGGDKVVAKKLKAESGWAEDDNEKGKSRNGTDDYGFSALPGGSCSAKYGCSNVGSLGTWRYGGASRDVYAIGDAFTGWLEEGENPVNIRCIKD